MPENEETKKRRWTNEEITEYRKERPGFYFNKLDTRIFVPKAYGFGMTMNWANPLAWAALAAIIAAVVCIRIFLR